jgi:CDP-diacylglycerol---glycerol-3-phosphate 3-phosphatidyltransferase
VANIITLSRFPILLLVVTVLYSGSPAVRLFILPLLFIGLMLDSVDGMVARRRNRTSLLGSVLDIAADRSYELVLWVIFADLDLIPVAIPLIVIVRTALTDNLRSLGVQRGERPFDQHRSRLGRFIVGSAWMRSAYSISKITAFCGLAAALGLVDLEPDHVLSRWAPTVLTGSRFLAWTAAAICLIRGLPVVIGAFRRSWRPMPTRSTH